MFDPPGTVPPPPVCATHDVTPAPLVCKTYPFTPPPIFTLAVDAASKLYAVFAVLAVVEGPIDPLLSCTVMLPVEEFTFI